MSSDLSEHARSAQVDQLLTEAKRALEMRRSGLALNAFLRATDLSLGSEELRRRVFDKLLYGAVIVTGTDWRVAESMLSLAEGLNVNWRAPTEIWEPIERELCEEYIRNVLADVNRSEPIENLAGFRGRLLYALHRYPGDPRLAKRLQSIERALEAPPRTPPPPAPILETVGAKRAEVPVPLPEVAGATWTRTRGFGVAAAVLLLSTMAFFAGRHKPTVSELDAAAKTYVVPPPKPQTEDRSPRLVRTIVDVPVPHQKQGIAANPKALPPLGPPATLDLAVDRNLAQDQWNNREIVEGIEQAEKALHDQAELKNKTVLVASARADAARREAEQALGVAALQAREQAEASNAVTTVLERYVNAWNTKDVEGITTLHRSLDRRTVKAQLAPVTAIRMTITPTSAAEVDGERATIVCRRQVEETFSDGTEKQSPPLLVTFALSKRDGEWSIVGTQ
jgi:hypothetical protein